MIHGAASMNSAVIAVRPRSRSQIRLDATRQARARSPFSRSSVKTGTKAPVSAASATSARTRFGTWKATVNALMPAPSTPKNPRTTISRTSPRTRERPVAAENARSTRRAGGREPWRLWTELAHRRFPRDQDTSGLRGLLRRTDGSSIPGPQLRALLRAMANIKQQKKRACTAARERLQNLRYGSTVKTLTRRLESAVADGDSDRIASTHKELQQSIDRATSRGALHRNAAARKKGRLPPRLEPVAPPTPVPSPGRRAPRAHA